MRRIIISHTHQTIAERAKKMYYKNTARNNTRKYGKDLRCSKCGKSLKVGEPAFRTSRKYLCENCGIQSEIDA